MFTVALEKKNDILANLKEILFRIQQAETLNAVQDAYKTATSELRQELKGGEKLLADHEQLRDDFSELVIDLDEAQTAMTATGMNDVGSFGVALHHVAYGWMSSATVLVVLRLSSSQLLLILTFRLLYCY